eukprot:g5398.t1
MTKWNSSGSLNIAMSGNGVSVRTHYDASHNFLAQISGVKRLLLAPPNSFDMFPEAHPAHRQIQPLDAKRKIDSYPDVFEAVLYPGEMLYIPPYWLHHVDYANDLGISINVWSQAEERNIIGAAWQLVESLLECDNKCSDSSSERPLPLWALPKFVCFLVNSALRNGNDDNASRLFLKEIVASRYASLGVQLLNCTSLDISSIRIQCDALAPELPEGVRFLSEWRERAVESGRLLGLVAHFGLSGHAVRDLILTEFSERAVRTRMVYEAESRGLRNPKVLGALWVCPFFRCALLRGV